MKTKNVIGIKSYEKELYHIFKDLEKHGRTTFSYDNVSTHNSIGRSIGIRGKPLIEKGLFLPPAATRKHRINIVALPIGVEIKEIEKGKFHFKRRIP